MKNEEFMEVLERFRSAYRDMIDCVERDCYTKQQLSDLAFIIHIFTKLLEYKLTL